ncbi:MAG: DUF115 domain-containing protein [Firmicutes bacterium]|nr:DUF115 domain-containing protein [Bacillota bacterium]
MAQYCASIVNLVRKSVLVIDLPAYGCIFPEKRQLFFPQFEKQLDNRRFSLTTLAAYQKRWTINSINNLQQILETPNLLLEAKDRFKSKPAVMVASGPSLEAEIENLRHIREKGLAYIFSIGSAINTLVQNDIHPHGACTYDPSEENQIVCLEVLEKGIHSIPLIFGSTVGFETLVKYPGPKIHMLISQDALAAFYLKPLDGKEKQSVNDAATIAVITLQLLYKLGFDPIVLVGQNLSYLDGKNYASGSTYSSHESSQAEVQGAVLVKDVYGGEIQSNQSFIRMRQQIESYLSHYRDRDIINTTRQGAHIEGTRFQSLKEVINDRLRDRVVEERRLEWTGCSYDLEHLIQQSRVVNRAFLSVAEQIRKCKNNLDNISELAENQDLGKVQRSYDQFNQSMETLRNNPFFATFISPMNRVELELLILAVPNISRERESRAKARLMEQEFRPFLLGCEQDLNNIASQFREMDQSIQKFYRIQTNRKKAARIKALLVDGSTLTDGGEYHSTFGETFMRFSTRDRDGITKLRDRGVITLLANPQANPIIDTVAIKWGMKILPGASGVEQMIAAVQGKYAFTLMEIACIFNDRKDLSRIKDVGLSFTVGDAPLDLRRKVDHVLSAKGGQGAIEEIAELFIENRIAIRF